MESLDVPKRWFADNVDRILKIYGSDHPITRENLVLGELKDISQHHYSCLLLVIGTLNSPDYALYVSHKHPDGQVRKPLNILTQTDRLAGSFQCVCGCKKRTTLGDIHSRYTSISESRRTYLS